MGKAGLCVLSLFFWLGTSGHAQSLQPPLHAAYLGSGVCSRNQADVFSFTVNQAAIAGLKSPSFGVYGERRYLQKELAGYILAAGLLTKSGNFGITAGYYGSPDYNETGAGLAYGRSLGAKADAGVQFNYRSVKLSGGYGSASALGVEAGVIFHLSEKLHAGLHVANPVGGKFGKDKQEKLPSVYSFGIGYEVSGKFFCHAEVVKEEDQPVSINTAISYRFIPSVSVKAGIATGTSTTWLGVNFLTRFYQAGIITSYHPQLGFTPGLLFLFSIKSKKAT